LLLGLFLNVINVEFFLLCSCVFALQCAIYPFCFYVPVVRFSVQQMLLIITVASIVFDRICTFLKPCCVSTSACPMYILGQSNSLSGVFHLDWTYLFSSFLFLVFFKMCYWFRMKILCWCP